MVSFWVSGFHKYSGFVMVENKISENVKENSLKYRATGFGF